MCTVHTPHLTPPPLLQSDGRKKLADVEKSRQELKSQKVGVKMVPVTLPSLLELSLRGVQELVCQFSIKAVSHMAQENRRWREKANEGIIGCSEEEEDEIKVLSS